MIQAAPGPYPIHLAAADLEPSLLAGLPAQLRQDFQFSGAVTPEDYVQLTGDREFHQLKARLSAAAQSGDDYRINISIADLLVHTGGAARSMQAAVLRWFLSTAERQSLQTVQAWHRLAKTLEELDYPALNLLLDLAARFHYDPEYIEPYDLQAALDTSPVELTLADFAHPQLLEELTVPPDTPGITSHQPRENGNPNSH